MTESQQNTALIATKLASETAAKAAELATETSNAAVALASKTAESMAIISTDISWMKKSLSGIENKLNEMDKAFVTSEEHATVCTAITDHESRLRKIEDNMGKWLGGIAVIVFVVSMAISFLLKFIRV